MNHTLDAFVRSWPWDPWLVATLAISRRHLSARLARFATPPAYEPVAQAQAAAFVAGLAAVYLALASPIEPFAAFLLSVHMVQHLLLMMVAPPCSFGSSSRCCRWCAGHADDGPPPLGRPAAAARQSLRTSANFQRLTHPLLAPCRSSSWRLGSGIFRRCTTWPCDRAAGITSSIRAFSPRHWCSGIRWCSPIRAAHAGRLGYCFHT